MVREPGDVDRHRELRRRPRPDAGHGEQARVGLVALEQRRRLGLEGPGLVEGLRYPGGQEPDLPVLGLDERRRGRGRGGRGLPRPRPAAPRPQSGRSPTPRRTRRAAPATGGPTGRRRPRGPGRTRSSTARRRFLSLVAQATTWSRCDERARAASRASPRPGTPDRESGTPRAVRAITAASRSSVLASPANSPAARLAARPGRWATPRPAARARLTARDPMLRNWSTTTSVPAGAEANSASSSASLLRTGALDSTSRRGRSGRPSGRTCRRLGRARPRAWSMALSRWYPSGSRSTGWPPLGTHITSRGACPALSYQPSGAARPAPAVPNRPLSGQGRSAVRGRPSAARSGRASIVARDGPGLTISTVMDVLV